MVKRYTSWDVVTDVGENIFVLEADYATLLAERDRLRECVSDFMSIYYERDVLCQDGSGHVDRCRCRKCVKHRARKAMEGRDGQ